MEYTVWQGDKPIKLIHDDLESSINVDDLTKIDTSNLFGEFVTIPALTNRIGLLKAETAERMAEAKLQINIFEGDFKARLRKQAANDSGYFKLRVGKDEVRVKATESALSSAHETDNAWIELKKEFIKAESNFNKLESLHWSCQDKARKLKELCSGTTPEDFISGLIEGKLNGITIKKK